ncbi:unnamed protein product, partial [Rotaria sp. Silwood1]
FDFALGIAFYNLPAIIVGMINDYFGPRCLKLIAIIFHLISWLSLGFVEPKRDWLLLFHTIFLSLAGICTLLSSFSISANFSQHRGLVTALISGAQLTGSICAMLFLDWRFTCMNLTLKSKSTKIEVKTITTHDTLIQYLKNPLFIVVTLFLSCLLLTISYLPVVWFKWLMHVTGNNTQLTNHYTRWYNMIAILGILVAPICGFIIDFKSDLGYKQKMFNISILQTLTWIGSVALCIVCMFQSIYAAIIALIILIFSRTMLVAGSQALIATVFPPQFIGSLLGIMWTTAGIISFATYALILLATDPRHIWRGWAIILFLCIIMSGHLIQVWILYASSQSSWSIRIPFFDNSHDIIHIPLQSSLSREKIYTLSCRNCFTFYTMTGGRRMIVEPCGGHNCISIINNTDLEDYNEPTEDYDLNKCGVAQNDRLLKKRALQLKISTSVKNTLRPAEYPWLVRIESRSSTYSHTVTLCGGTLIHPQWIITAAHCMFDTKTNRLYPAEGINLFMGHYDRLRTSQTEYIQQPVLYLIHPKFRISRISPAPIHDLALIKLARSVPLSRSINIACLPESTDKLNDGTLAFTAGWGHSSPDSTVVNLPRKARIRISPRSCRNLMVDKKLHICGRNERGNNICSGDSGTGLMVNAGIKSTNNKTIWKWHLFGVASFGLDECSQNVNHDNAFASISVDIDWIHDVMKKY